MRHSHRWLIGVVMALALTVAVGLIATGGEDSLAANDIIYVDADATSGNNDGTSWEDAYITLQPALDAAPLSGDRIWVAAGTYKPSQESSPGDPRSATFQLKNGVALYGGFDPTVGDIAWEDRDWVNHETILSGDLNGDDVPPFGNNGENSYHVFYHPSTLALDDTAVLDGFTVRGGYGNEMDTPHGRGGGMSNDACSPTLANCVFFCNWADMGGGISNHNSSPMLANCTFAINEARFVGGGMLNENPSSPLSSPTLTDCTFAGNSADIGGGMYNRISRPTLTDCLFYNNSAEDSMDGVGGGMANWMSTPKLTGVIFFGNRTTGHGGGMCNANYSPPRLTNCLFIDNIADTDNALSGNGGGMYNINNSNPVLTATHFYNNRANFGGGMGNRDDSSPTLANAIFTLNTATDDGGAMHNEDNSGPTVTNVTFTGNQATGHGGGMTNLSSSNPTLTNCILWGNTPEEVHNSGGTASVTYSDVQGGYTGVGNMDADPLFVDAGSYDFHLSLDSPCIDVGDNDAPGLPAYDFDGNDRILDGDGNLTAIVDMGVDEVAVDWPYFHIHLPVVLRGY